MLPDQRMVFAELVTEPIVEEIQSTVTDMSVKGILTDDLDRGQSRAHAIGGTFLHRGLEYVPVRFGKGFLEIIHAIDPSRHFIEIQGFDRDQAGNFTGIVPAHAVGDGIQPVHIALQQAVFVVLAHPTDVGDGVTSHPTSRLPGSRAPHQGAEDSTALPTLSSSIVRQGYGFSEEP